MGRRVRTPVAPFSSDIPKTRPKAVIPNVPTLANQELSDVLFSLARVRQENPHRTVGHAGISREDHDAQSLISRHQKHRRCSIPNNRQEVLASHVVIAILTLRCSSVQSDAKSVDSRTRSLRDRIASRGARTFLPYLRMSRLSKLFCFHVRRYP